MEGTRRQVLQFLLFYNAKGNFSDYQKVCFGHLMPNELDLGITSLTCLITFVPTPETIRDSCFKALFGEQHFLSNQLPSIASHHGKCNGIRNP